MLRIVVAGDLFPHSRCPASAGARRAPSKGKKPCPDLPVVEIGARADGTPVRKALRRGVHEFPGMPFDFQAIEMRVVEKLESTERIGD